MTTKPAGGVRSLEEIQADLDAWINAGLDAVNDLDERNYLDVLSERLIDDIRPLVAEVVQLRQQKDERRFDEIAWLRGLRAAAQDPPMDVWLMRAVDCRRAALDGQETQK